MYNIMIYVNKMNFVLAFLSQILITLPKLILEFEKPVFVHGMYSYTLHLLIIENSALIFKFDI